MRDEPVPPRAAADLASGGLPTAQDEDSAAAPSAPSRAADATADRVGSILEAAEKAASEMRRDAEDRVRARIAEADRGAENRVKAAEEEAAEILAAARKEAAKLRKDSKAEAKRAIDEATSKGLEVGRRMRPTGCSPRRERRPRHFART